MDTKITLAGLIAAWYAIKLWIDRLSRIVEPIVKDIEQRALDGKIDAKDRKEIALTELARLEKEGVIKLSYINRLIISKIIDIVAQKLPDYNVTKAELQRKNA